MALGRRGWVLAGAGGLAVIALAVILIFTLGGGGAAEAYANAHDDFHTRYTPLADQVDQKIALAGDGILDPTLGEAQQSAREIADAFEAYSAALGALAVPEDTADELKKLREVVDLGETTWVNIAGFFSRGQMKNAVVQFRPTVESNLKQREDALHAALNRT